MKTIKLFKHLFIPHLLNDYKPHFFRELSVAIILFFSIFLLGLSAGSSHFFNRTVKGVTVAATVLVDLANESRVEANQAPLLLSTQLESAANLKVGDMITNGYFAHDSPTGVTPWHWLDKVNYKFLYAGENLAINFTEAKDVNEAWLKSPGHRANLLNVNFKEIGIATREGYYNGAPTIFIVQMFGTPAVASAGTLADNQPTITPVAAVETKKVAVAQSNVIPKTETVKTEAPQTKIENIITTNELAVVKNTEAVAQVSNDVVVPKYSKWYERFIFLSPEYINIIYKILIMIIALALVTMILVEIKKQHFKHILYGAMMLTFLSVLVYMNNAFI